MGAALSLCCVASIARAQDTSVIVRLRPETPRRVFIEGSMTPSRVWSFRNSYGGVPELGARIEHLELFDSTGAEIAVRKIAPGQFETAADASRFRYEVNLTPPARSSDTALVSWMDTERGLLMPGDLLPLFPSRATASPVTAAPAKTELESLKKRARIRVSLPDGWAAYANEKRNASGEFEVADADRAVFVIGRHLRISRTTTAGMTLTMVAGGDWAFTDGESLELAGQVLKAHRDVLGDIPTKQTTLILLPFPQTVAAGKWSAETRGATVTLLSGQLPSKTAALAQLSVPLTHELFHLWVPNGLVLDGSYDWFYEGFTIYQAARTSVRLQLLTFQEFLNAIGRAYDAYTAPVDRDRWSLVEASQRRWTGGESAVYQKSMLMAFIYDLKLRKDSNGKRSLDTVYREIFRQYHSNEGDDRNDAVGPRADGNDAIISALGSVAGMKQFADVFFRRPMAINLEVELAPYGLRVERMGLRSYVRVSESLDRRERDLLRELGYNDYGRSSTKRK